MTKKPLCPPEHGLPAYPAGDEDASEPPEPVPYDVGLPERSPIRPSEAAEYIAQMTAELAFIARGARLDLLAYLLEMARTEALSKGDGLSG